MADKATIETSQFHRLCARFQQLDDSEVQHLVEEVNDPAHTFFTRREYHEHMFKNIVSRGERRQVELLPGYLRGSSMSKEDFRRLHKLEPRDRAREVLKTFIEPPRPKTPPPPEKPKRKYGIDILELTSETDE